MDGPGWVGAVGRAEGGMVDTADPLRPLPSRVASDWLQAVSSYFTE